MMKVQDLTKKVENFDLVLGHFAIMPQKGAEVRKEYSGGCLGTALRQQWKKKSKGQAKQVKFGVYLRFWVF